MPASYSTYNLYNGYKVVLNEPKPYLKNNVYKTKYKVHAQVIQPAIRDSRDAKYYVVKGHPKFNGSGKVKVKTVKGKNVKSVIKSNKGNNGNGNNGRGNGKGKK